MGGFCPHEWHQTTEADLQHMALGSDEYLYAVWETETDFHRRQSFNALQRRHDLVVSKAHALAEQRNLIPYAPETFEALMREVEADAQSDTTAGEQS